LRIVILAYLGLGLMLYLFQNVLIFPGAYIHPPSTMVAPQEPGLELLTLRTADGHRVTAIYGKALTADDLPDPNAESRPTIIYFYGNGDCLRWSTDIFQNFRRLGANVLIPEFVGYPLSGGKPSEANVYATANAAYEYLRNAQKVEPAKIVLVGRSLGSAAAIDLASRQPVGGLVTISAFTTMGEMAQKVVPIFPVRLVLSSQFPNIDKISKVSCPILLMHGDRDNFVPFGMMARLAAAARGPVTQLTIPGADHNSVFVAGRQLVEQKVAEFLSQTLHFAPSQARDNEELP
jgi:hypothetical protein